MPKRVAARRLQLGTDVFGRQQFDFDPQTREAPCPEVGGATGEPRRESVIEIKQLRFASAQPRIAQPHR
jgi:hypothetical protein